MDETTTLHTRDTGPGSGRRQVYDGRWLRLERLTLGAGDETRVEAPARDECVVVLVAGALDWDGRAARRASPFEERAHAAHLPAGSALDIRAAAGADLLVATSRLGDAPAGGDVTLIAPEDVTVQHRGRDQWVRDVHDVVVAQAPARHLMVGETFNPPGGWSSFPPHKHDGRDGEPELEEAYHFRFDPPDGFGFQAVDVPGAPQAFVVRDGDTVGIPRGYHPVCAAPGYRLYYCWVLAGPVRRLQMVEDPRYTWLHERGAERAGQVEEV